MGDAAGTTSSATHATTLTVGAIASAGAAIVHAAAAGIHADHPALSRIFIALALAQGAVAIAAFVRRDRAVCAGLFVVNAAAAAGWLITRITGIDAIDGLQAAESPQPADTIAAALAIVAAATAVACARGHSSVVPTRSLTMSAVIVGALLVPGLADTTSHTHAGTDHDHGAEPDTTAHVHVQPDTTGGTSTTTEHVHAPPEPTAATPATTVEHVHESGVTAGTPGTTAEPPTTVEHVHEAATVPYDPELPIDLGGVDGVTPQQQAFAENLVAATVRDLPQWADPAVAEAAGFRSIGDGGTGHEHYIQWDWIDDDVYLDPDRPESLVYQPGRDGSKQLVSAMYMLPGGTSLDEVPDWGGALMQWHVHGDLCFTDDPEAPQVAGLKPIGSTCAPPLVDGTEAPMIHVWIVPQECGPFAALEGVGGGQVPDGEAVLCDHAHGSG